LKSYIFNSCKRALTLASGATNLFMGDSWTAQEARVKAGLQERNTALDNVSWKNYDHIMKDKSLSIDDKVKAIFNGEPIAENSVCNIRPR
jgi:hypothetical protein